MSPTKKLNHPRRTTMRRKHSRQTPPNRKHAHKDSAQRLWKAMPAALVAARKRAGLTQVDVGREASMTSEVYGRMERGATLPSLPTLLRLCETLCATPGELLGFTRVFEGTRAAEATLSKVVAHLDDTPELRRLLRALIGMPRGRVRLFAELALATLGSRR